MIARAAAASVLHGTGTARLGAELGVPAATVRDWLRRLRSRVGQTLQEATAEFGRLVAVIETAEGRDQSPPGPTGSPLGDALGPRRRVRCGHGQVARPGRDGPGGTDRPVRPRRCPRDGTWRLIPPRRPWHPRARNQPATLIMSIRRHSP